MQANVKPPSRRGLSAKMKLLIGVVAVLVLGGVAAAVAVAVASSGGGDSTTTVSTEVVLSGSISDFTPTVQNALKTKVATELGVTAAAVSITVVSASVRMTIAVALSSEGAASTAASTLTVRMGSTSAASTFLSTPELAITVESIAAAPMIASDPAPAPSPPPTASPPPTNSEEETSSGGGASSGGANSCLGHTCWTSNQAPTSTLKILCLHGGGGSGGGSEFGSLAMSGVTFVCPNGGYSAGGGTYVWVPDPPGGKSQPTTDRDVADVSVDALNAIVTQQGPFDAILGYSQGSMMVLYYLSRVPVGTFRFAMMFCGCARPALET